MITRKALAVFGLALASLIVLPNTHASEIDQATKLTFNRPVQIPGRVLPAGTYLFTVDPGSHILRIFDQDRVTVYATLLTISSEHLTQAETTQITLADRGSMQPEAIVTWFYPGRTSGYEFLYSKQDHKEIAQAKRHTVVAGE
jgi:hypothetical protein